MFMARVMTSGEIEPDVTKFPTPHTWATFIPGRTEVFKTHSSLGLAKTAISGSSGRMGGVYRMVNGKQRYCKPLPGAWVYEFVDEAWVERYRIAAGTFPDEHPLWKITAKTRKPVSEKAVGAAIKSILEEA